METTALVPVRFRLAPLLEESGLSQRRLAEIAGVSPTIINRMANNLAGQVSLKTLDSLCAALSEQLGRNVEPGELLERDAPAKRRGRGG
ncbi:MAG TPA: helix-turn-helix domain-containing protein [Gemmatimonadaceae bacterium]|nr:helix-turn-helix domain-containing protein [Gemmatimonadaceae bacterium]